MIVIISAIACWTWNFWRLKYSMHFQNSSEIVICIKFSEWKKTQKCPIFDIFEHKRAFSRKSKHFEKFSSCGIFFLSKITPRKHHITQHYRYLFLSAYGRTPDVVGSHRAKKQIVLNFFGEKSHRTYFWARNPKIWVSGNRHWICPLKFAKNAQKQPFLAVFVYFWLKW